MVSSRKNKTLYIDTEALSSLALVQEGLITPVTKLMNKAQADEVDETKVYKGVPFPFSFILAPSGRRNEEVLLSLKKGEEIDLVNEGYVVGSLIVEETFEIDPVARVVNIFGTCEESHAGVTKTINRIGKIAVSGEYHVTYPIISQHFKRVKSLIKSKNAKTISSIMLNGSPLHRAHERVLRQALDDCDLLIIFLLKPFNTIDGLRYDIRHDALCKFIENFLPQNKVIVVPLETSYIFAGYNELILDALVARNYGCNRLVVGKNHDGLGLYYDENRLNTIFDSFKNIKIEIKTTETYVYCNQCRTLVSTTSCPHGSHHHIHYHSPSILKLIENGIMPPSILVRREVSASILSALFPNRFDDDLQEIYYALMPSSGIIEKPSQEDFYVQLMGLYQTSSLT